MKTLTGSAQYITEALAILLIFRLFYLPDRKNKLYAFFAAFLGLQLTESIGYFACVHWVALDYRNMWIIFTFLALILYPILVYFLVQAVLAEIPGVMQFSQRLLVVAFSIGTLVAFASAQFEYSVTKRSMFETPIGRLLSISVVADKAISLVSVIVLIAILAFILWFPVKMSKNLAVFSVGFVVFFTAKSGLHLLTFYTSLSTSALNHFGVFSSLVVVACFIYWLIFMDSKGATVSVRMGHSWQAAEQAKLIDRLESMNEGLLRSARRLKSSNLS